MGERSEYTPGTFCFADVGTNDRAGSAAFYTELFGWTAEPFEDGQGDYWNFRNSVGWLNGGVMALAEPEVPPHRQVLFTVEDAGVAVDRVQDPVGAVFSFFDGEPDP